jgi:hypothetical protein
MKPIVAAFLLCSLGAAAIPRRAMADCAQALDTRTIPLPVWSTSPNEGDTWGAMPVFIRVCPADQRTQWILAPSLTWNSVIKYTGTLRFYDYPDPDTAFTLVASPSTNINYQLFAIWQRLPEAPGAWTTEATLRVERNVFDRFFGLGPDTLSSAETSYTGVRQLMNARRGVNVIEHLNIGASIGIEHDSVEDRGVPGLPLAPDVVPDAPGMRGASLFWQGLDIRYDDRRGGDFAERGIRLEASGAVVEGLSGSPTFLRLGAQARGIVPELSWLSGAARAAWSEVTSADVPFYQQSELGGSYLLRGFTTGRFVDRQLWTIEAEQRIRLVRTRIFGVVADWRVDPFVAVGQVFGDWDRALSRPRMAVGAGLRAFVRPNVLGRVDIATGGEGTKIYVEIGYPY